MKNSTDINNAPEVKPPAKLSEEDMARVAEYLNSPNHRNERAPFRPWVLLLVLTLAVSVVSAVSMFYAWQQGIRIL